MGNLATIKGILVTAIQGLPEFSSKAADVHAHRAVQPENEQEPDYHDTRDGLSIQDHV